jgi:primosomal protein N' (replication factor Y)
MIKDSVLNKKIIPVWLPIPSFQPYCYILPDEMKTSPGSLVRVPLGSRELIGLVSDDVVPVFSSSIKLRVVSKVFNFPPINQELLEFVRFVSSYTLAPLGLVARMVLKISISFEEDMNEEGLLYSGLIPEHITSARSRVIELLMRTPRVWPRSQLLREAGVSSRVLERLKAQGVLKSINLAYQSVISAATASVDKPVLLEKAQRQAANLLQAAVLEKRFSVSLLDGVTGSGKTEVYFEAIAETLQKDLQVLILVPEISLTPQLLDRFASRFGHAPSEWHSDVPRLQRNRIWSQVAQGGIRVVAGARSALFLPFQKLGLIIVDEEHDSAYKQEDKIFYNARDMAVARGSIANIPVILASATPSLESYVNVKRGRYRYIHLSSRFSNAAMPHLKAIDLRVNRPSSGHFLSPILLRAMRDVLEGGKQSLLFLNRRGYAPLTLCRFCGHRFSCPNCSTWLVEHRSSSSLQCHHCNYHKIIPEICPECGLSEHLVACGPGIERIAEEVKENLSSRVMWILLLVLS